MIDIMIAALIIGYCAWVIIKQRRDRKAGGCSGCCGSCSGCSSCSHGSAPAGVPPAKKRS